MSMLHNVRRILNLDDGAGWRGVDSDIGIDLQLVWRVSSRLEATSYGGSAPEKVERRGKWRGGGDDCGWGKAEAEDNTGDIGGYD